jgi:hypothetical protein
LLQLSRWLLRCIIGTTETARFILDKNSEEIKTAALEKEIQYLRERELAVINFLYGVAVGFFIYWMTNYERQID